MVSVVAAALINLLIPHRAFGSTRCVFLRAESRGAENCWECLRKLQLFDYYVHFR